MLAEKKFEVAIKISGDRYGKGTSHCYVLAMSSSGCSCIHSCCIYVFTEF